MPDPVIRLSICAIDFSFFFFIFPLPGLVFERRDRELEEAGGDLSMFAGDRGGAEAGKVCLPWTNLSEQVCVRTGLCMYLFSFSLSVPTPSPSRDRFPPRLSEAPTPHTLLAALPSSPSPLALSRPPACRLLSRGASAALPARPVICRDLSK